MGKPSFMSDAQWEEFCHAFTVRQQPVLEAELEFARSTPQLVTADQADELWDWFMR